jgi:hypothetical protein
MRYESGKEVIDGPTRKKFGRFDNKAVNGFEVFSHSNIYMSSSAYKAFEHLPLSTSPGLAQDK